MKDRRRFLAALSGVAVPVGMALATSKPARADDTKFLGTWILKHPSPVGPYFLETMCFSAGGGLQENNSLLNGNSKFPMAVPGVGTLLINANDGLGSWSQGPHGEIQFEFRKLLFDASGAANIYIGQLKVVGTAKSDGSNLEVTWTAGGIVNDDGVMLVNIFDPTQPNKSMGSWRIG